MAAATASTKPSMPPAVDGGAEVPWPGRSSATTRWRSTSSGATSTQLDAAPPSPWSSTTGGPEPPTRPAAAPERPWRVAAVTRRQYPGVHHGAFREAGPLTPAKNKERRDEPDCARCAGGLF